MQRMKKYIAWTAGLLLLMVAGSLLRSPHWVASAASAIFSSPVSNVRETNRRPYQVSATVVCNISDTFCLGGPTNAVPDGFQLVVDHISVSVVADSSITSMSVHVDRNSDETAFPLIPGGDAGAGTTLFVGTQSVKSVVPSGGNIGLVVQGQVSQKNTAHNFHNADFTFCITGYLESCSAFPGGVCPAIVEH